jgi:pimeloyl-[acyl-carrier protein] methyl ester esterase
MLYSNTQGIGTDLVLLHGWGFNSALFSHLVDAYKNQYRITLIDLPGHGRSANVDGGLNEWCNEIIKILPNNPILLGWSLGGLLAINIANKIKISQLILLASTPKFIKDNDWNYGIDANNFEQFSNTLQLDPTQGLKRFISLQTDNKTQLKSLKRSLDTLPASPNALAQGLGVRCADTTCTSYGMPNCSSISTAFFMVGQSDFDPIITPTSAPINFSKVFVCLNYTQFKVWV